MQIHSMTSFDTAITIYLQGSLSTLWSKIYIYIFFWFFFFYLDSSRYWLSTQINNLPSGLASIGYCVPLKQTLLERFLLKALEPRFSLVYTKAMVTVSNALHFFVSFRTNEQLSIAAGQCAWYSFTELYEFQVTLAARFSCQQGNVSTLKSC